MKNNQNKVHKMAKVLDLPQELFNKGAKLEMSDNTELILEGCKGIVNYDIDNIKINTGRSSIIILGNNLFVKSFVDQNIIINGYIKSIEFDT